VRFASFFSGGFITVIRSGKSTKEKTWKTHLNALLNFAI
jgi:hypothetical protein